MEATTRTAITVECTVNVPVAKAWEVWSDPKHITQWCQASEDWHAPFAENDLRTGGQFKTTMAAKDGSYSFDFGGVYDKVDLHKAMEYTMGDGRKVQVYFTDLGNATKITETFEAEDTNPVEMQRGGWQAIMDSYKKHTEAQ